MKKKAEHACLLARSLTHPLARSLAHSFARTFATHVARVYRMRMTFHKMGLE